MSEISKHIHDDLMLSETEHFLCVRRNIYILKEILLSGQLTLSNVLKDMLKGKKLKTMVNACKKDAIKVMIPLGKKTRSN